MIAIFDIRNGVLPMPPGGVFIDTNILAALYNERNIHNEAVKSATLSFAQNDVPMFINPRITEELDHIVTREIYTQQAQELGKKRWVELFDHEKSYYHDLVKPEIDRIDNLIQQNPAIVNLPLLYDRKAEIFRRELAFKYGLLATDAVIWASMLLSGSNSILTLDEDFRLIDQVNVFSSARKLVNLIGKGTANELVDFPDIEQLIK